MELDDHRLREVELPGAEIAIETPETREDADALATGVVDLPGAAAGGAATEIGGGFAPLGIGYPGHMIEDEEAVERETEAAAAEAGEIGGRRPEDEPDSAEAPVKEAGGGEAEGFEGSEELLRERAEHQDPGGDPLADQGAPEEERDEATHGEADRVQPADQ